MSDHQTPTPPTTDANVTFSVASEPIRICGQGGCPHHLTRIASSPDGSVSAWVCAAPEAEAHSVLESTVGPMPDLLMAARGTRAMALAWRRMRQTAVGALAEAALLRDKIDTLEARCVELEAAASAAQLQRDLERMHLMQHHALHFSEQSLGDDQAVRCPDCGQRLKTGPIVDGLATTATCRACKTHFLVNVTVARALPTDQDMTVITVQQYGYWSGRPNHDKTKTPPPAL